MRGIRRIAITTAAAAAVALTAATALAGPGSTASRSVTLSGDGPASRSATCPVGTRTTGGGFSIARPYNPGADTGTRSMIQSSFVVGTRSFRSSAAMQAPSQPATGFKAFARCIESTRGPVASGFGEATLPPSNFANMRARCAPGPVKAIGGGFRIEGNATSFQNSPFVLQSRRVGERVWLTTIFNPPTAPGPVNVRYYAVCERADNGATKVRSRTATIPPDARRGVGAKCPRGWHTASGGFRLGPISETDMLLGYVDRSHPKGSRTWRAGAWTLGAPVEGEGGTLTVYAYCKRN